MTTAINKPDEITEGQTLRRAFSNSVIKSIDNEKRTIEFIISTAAADRYGDIIEVSGWDLRNYKANPVVLFGHNSSIPPVGKALKTWKDGSALRSVAEFMSRDLSVFADSIFRMFQEGYLRAVSVGFKPLKWEQLKDEQGDPTWAYRFTKQELLEFSAVPIPANPEALIAARQKGIDTAPFKMWAEEMLDNWNATGVEKLYGFDRKHVEDVRRRAAGVGMAIHVSQDVQDELMRKNLEAIRAAKAAKAGTQQSVTIKGVEYHLPQLDTTKMKTGHIVVQTDEVNGQLVKSILKADDQITLDPALLEGEEFTVEERDAAEGEEKEIAVTITLDGTSLTYNMLGVDGNGDLVAIKANDSDKPEEEEEEEKSSDASDDETTDEEDKAASTDEEEKPEEEDKSADEDDADEDEPETDKGAEGDEEKDEPVDFNTELAVLEHQLVSFEEALSKAPETETKAVRNVRKMKFLGGYLRELADALDGGVTETKQASATPQGTTTTKKVEETENKGFTMDEAKNYTESMIRALQPLLVDMVSKKISALKGRLD